MDPKRHALYMRPFGHLCDHTPFEDVLQDVLEDVFGLPPGPTLMATMGHEQRAVPWGGTPKTRMRMGSPKLGRGFSFGDFGGREGAASLKVIVFELFSFGVWDSSFLDLV